MSKINTIEDVFVEQLRDLYNAKKTHQGIA